MESTTHSPPVEGTIQVLLVEDDERLARLTSRYLQEHGILVTTARTGPEGLAEASRHAYDVILLDLMLPGRDGMEVCRELRMRSDIPIIMVTARGEEADRVLGLETGADDYLAKPYSSRELLARIRAHVRRARGRSGPASQPIQAGKLSMDPRSLRATLDGKELNLTTYEFGLLRVLAERAGRVLSREQLLDLIKGNAEEVFDRSVDVHIFRIRQKIEEDPRNPKLLKTVRGAGYMLATGGEEA
jgi:DNA-binding response OmpR family regulator